MKQKFIYMQSVAAALLATACTDDMGVQDIPVVAGKGQLVQVGANMNPASRMSFPTILSFRYISGRGVSLFFICLLHCGSRTGNQDDFRNNE